MSVAQPTSSRPTAIASAVPRRNRSSSEPRMSAAAAEPVVGQLAVARQPPDDRDRDPGELALDQVTGGGEFVGDGDLGDLEDVAVGVGAPARIGQRGQPGHADGRVGDAGPPRAAPSSR